MATKTDDVFEQKIAALEAAQNQEVDDKIDDEKDDGVSEEEKLKEQFFDRLHDQFGDSAPTPEILDNWRDQFERVRWMEFGPSEIYFFRGCRANEYNSWIKSLAGVAAKDPEQADKILKERVVTSCVIFPKIDPESTGGALAGTIDTLFTQIQLASNFIPLEMANTMVREW